MKKMAKILFCLYLNNMNHWECTYMIHWLSDGKKVEHCFLDISEIFVYSCTYYRFIN